jgi:imidazoleglycerol phosphate dehydratase HisB
MNRFDTTPITQAHQDANGIWRWNSNDRVPFDDMLQSWGLDFATRARCAAARDADNRETLARYVEARKNVSPEQLAEEAFERRAAFGPGVEVVDILTGQRMRT